MERRLWLIDAGYMIKAQNSVSPAYSFDYLKLKNRLEESGEVWRSYYLNSCRYPLSDGQKKFHSWLESASPYGPKIITKLYDFKMTDAYNAYCEGCETTVKLRCPNVSGHILKHIQQKGVDVGIATLALKHKDHYDTLVLSSGDGDLIDAIEHLSESGKRIELLVFKVAVSTELQARADSVHWIDDFASEVEKSTMV